MCQMQAIDTKVICIGDSWPYYEITKAILVLVIISNTCVQWNMMMVVLMYSSHALLFTCYYYAGFMAVKPTLDPTNFALVVGEGI